MASVYFLTHRIFNTIWLNTCPIDIYTTFKLNKRKKRKNTVSRGKKNIHVILRYMYISICITFFGYCQFIHLSVTDMMYIDDNYTTLQYHPLYFMNIIDCQYIKIWKYISEIYYEVKIKLSMHDFLCFKRLRKAFSKIIFFLCRVQLNLILIKN